jgi:uncharacterized protein involved in exopolysaccharide biosynthesis/Mrp family chromosome partitioning ATPase
MENDRASFSAQSGLVLAAVRHHALLIAACALGGLILAGLFTVVRPATYVASASVLVNPAQGNPFAPQSEGDSLVSLETEAQVVQSDAVTTLALNRLPDGVTRGALQGGLSVVIPPNTQVLQISSSAPGAPAARRRAQAYATAYLDFRRQQARRTLDEQLASIQQQINRANDQLQAAGAAAAQADTSEELAFQQDLAQALHDELVELRASRLTQVQDSLTQPGRVISPAQQPLRPAGLPVALLLLVGAVAGLLLGLVLALVRETRGDTVYELADIERAGLPVVAALRRRYRPYSDQSPTDDMIRHLRAHVMTTVPTPAVLAVATCSPRLDEPGIAARLSTFLGRAGVRVVLVDAAPGDLDPTGTVAPGRGPGLAEMLLDERVRSRDLLVAESSRLSVLPRGPRFEEALDRFVPGTLEDALGKLSEGADVVVLRVPSLLEAPGVATLSVARQVLLVVTPGLSTRAEIETAVGSVRDAGCDLLGAVVSASVPWWSHWRLLGRRAEHGGARRAGGHAMARSSQGKSSQGKSSQGNSAVVPGGSATPPWPM